MEYKILEFDNRFSLEDEINLWAKAGWELINITYKVHSEGRGYYIAAIGLRR